MAEKMKELEPFTFGVLAFNQEDIVLETLESIKYQIKCYGEERQIDLLVIDDASTDGTLKTIEKWLYVNHELFHNSRLIGNKINQGTVKNYNFLLSKIKSEKFKIIAGDDLISSDSLFDKYDLLDRVDILSCFFLTLRDNQISFDMERLKKFLYNQCHSRSNRNLKEMRRGCFFHTPSTIYRRNLYEESSCETLNSQFQLFEDDPTWYSMLKNTKDIKLCFSTDVMILYRIHNKSVSNSETVNSLFSKELRKLQSVYYEDSKGIERIYFWFILHESIPKYLRFNLYYDHFMKWKYKLFSSRKKEFDSLLTMMTENVKKEQKYYDGIKDNVFRFKKKHLADSI